MRSFRWGVAGVAIGLALVAPACGSGGDRSASRSSNEMPSATGASDVDESVATGDRPGGAGSGAAAVGAKQVIAASRELVRTGSMTVVAKDVGAAVVAAEDAAAALGGFVFGQQDSANGEDSAILTMKVPPDRFRQLLDDLAGLGEVESREVATEDVTSAGADLDARIVSAQRSVDRVRGFLDATENVNELAGIEAELTRRETELEQLVGQRRVLNDRVAAATVTLTVNATPAPVPPPPPAGDALRSVPGFGGALASAVGALVKVVRVLGAGLGYALPFAVAFGGPVLLWRAIRRRRRPTAGPPADAAAVAT